MADIVDFPTKAQAVSPEAVDNENASVIDGPAFCGACRHEWRAIVPVGANSHFECPKCNRFWGTFKNAITPGVAWVCLCGEDLFWLTPNGAMCRRCGLITTAWAETAPPAS